MGRIRDIGEVLIFPVSGLVLRSPLTFTSHLPPPTVTGCHEVPAKLREVVGFQPETDLICLISLALTQYLTQYIV